MVNHYFNHCWIPRVFILLTAVPRYSPGECHRIPFCEHDYANIVITDDSYWTSGMNPLFSDM